MSWLSDLIARHTSDDDLKFKRPTPRAVVKDPQRLDSQPYHNALNLIEQANQAGTAVARQVQQNRINWQREQELAEMRKRLQPIDLSGVQANRNPISQLNVAHRGSGQAGSGQISNPLAGYRISSGFGPRSRPTAGASTNHGGIDIAAPMGTPIRASQSGTVAGSTGWNNGYGWHITINGSGGIQTFYGHNQRNVVKPGQQVKQGQIIGYVGSTGVSTGPHLHYEVRVNGQRVNPANFL